jgi:hypothetical protein
MPDKETLDKFGDAVEQKNEQAREASQQPQANAAPEDALPPEQESRVDHAHEQADRDVRAKNSGHGQKTADKWNQ